MNISYLDFWPGFDPDCNWFNLAFREALGENQIPIITPPAIADVILFSGFGNQHKNCGNSKAIKVFSVKPDLEGLYHFIRRILKPKISGITGGLGK